MNRHCEEKTTGNLDEAEDATETSPLITRNNTASLIKAYTCSKVVFLLQKVETCHLITEIYQAVMFEDIAFLSLQPFAGSPHACENDN